MRGGSRDAGWVDAAPRDPTKPPSYVPIAAELLRRLYVDEELTVDAIAPRLGCATTTVFRRLRSFAIPVRPTGPIPRRHIHEIRWDPEVAYAVGLIATDGNLSRDGRHMSVTSKDQDLIETLRRCLRLSNSISRIQNRTGNFYHKVQWCDRGLYDWLLSIGLTPAKSLTLGPLAVPDECFADFFRGCIDGDGSVLVYVDKYHADKNERYVYERLYLSLVSASHRFLDWVRTTVQRLTGINGSIPAKRSAEKGSEGKHPVWVLRYAKQKSISLLRWIYYAPTVPCLGRKRATAERFLHPLGHASERPVGRPRVGWLYNTRQPGRSEGTR